MEYLQSKQEKWDNFKDQVLLFWASQEKEEEGEKWFSANNNNNNNPLFTHVSFLFNNYFSYLHLIMTLVKTNKDTCHVNKYFLNIRVFIDYFISRKHAIIKFNLALFKYSIIKYSAELNKNNNK